MELEKAPLAEALAVTLSDLTSYSYLLKGYHWNVLGADFVEFHDFFDGLYEDAYGAIDPTAENILKLGAEAPYLLTDFIELSSVREERIVGGDPMAMVASALKINAILLNDFNVVFDIASKVNEQGVADFAAGRVDAHAKWQWQLKAILGIR